MIAWSWPGSISFASANTGTMPGCDMSASIVSCAPVTALPDKSVMRRETVTGPTRGGCGEISSLKLSSLHPGRRFSQSATNTRQAQSAISKLLFRNTGLANRSRQRLMLQGAGTGSGFFARGRKQVVVHANHHRDEDDRVVEEMKFDAKLREQQLNKTDRHRRAEPVVMSQ